MVSGTDDCVNMAFWVRATSLLCLLGFGLGLGSVLIYKFCCKLFSPTSIPSQKKLQKSTRECSKERYQTSAEQFPESPDSAMGNDISQENSPTGSHPVCYSRDDDFVHIDYEKKETEVRYRNIQSRHSNGFEDSYDMLDKSYEDVRPRRAQDSTGHSITRQPLQGSGDDELYFASGHFNQSPPQSFQHRHSSGESFCNVTNEGFDGKSVYSMKANYSPASLQGRNERLRNNGGQFFGETLHESYETNSIENGDVFEESDNFTPNNYQSRYSKNKGAIPKTSRLSFGYDSRDEGSFDQSYDRDWQHARLGLSAEKRDISFGSLDLGFTPSECSSTRGLHHQRGLSLDFADMSSGNLTPDGSLFEASETGECALKMEKVERELQNIKDDLDDMKNSVEKLNSLDVPLCDEDEIQTVSPSMKNREFTKALKVLIRHKNRPQSLSVRSRSVSSDRDIPDGEVRKTLGYNNEYMWDYQSDLAAVNGDSFITQRPILSEEWTKPDKTSPTMEDIKNFIDQYLKTVRRSPAESTTTQSDAATNTEDCVETDEHVCEQTKNSRENVSEKSFQAKNTTESSHERSQDLNASNNNNSGSFCDMPHQTSQVIQTDNIPTEGHRPKHLDTRRSPEGSSVQNETCELIKKPSREKLKLDLKTEYPPPSSNRQYVDIDSYESASSDQSETSRKCVADSALSTSSENFDSPAKQMAEIDSDTLTDVGNNNNDDLDPLDNENNSTEFVSTVESVGDLVSLEDYVLKEWKGDTTYAETMRKGYSQIPTSFGLYHLRRIRGDNYCGLRSVLYQTLSAGLPLLKTLGSKEELIQEMETAFHDKNNIYLQKWSFANRIQISKNVFAEIKTCIDKFYKVVSEVLSVTDAKEREEKLLSFVNGNSNTEIQLYETCKLLMMLKAISLYKDYTEGNDVRVFVWLMFARDTSETPETLFKNHINGIGDSYGMEQVEMFLLAFILGVTIRVLRPSQHGNTDFVSFYPDDNPDTVPAVTVIAEDDRHYNIVLP